MKITTTFDIPETPETFDLFAQLIALSAKAADGPVIIEAPAATAPAAPAATPPKKATKPTPAAAPPVAAAAAPPAAAPPVAAAAAPAAAPPVAAAAPATKTEALDNVSDDDMIRVAQQHSDTFGRNETIKILKGFGGVNAQGAVNPRFVPQSSRLACVEEMKKQL